MMRKLMLAVPMLVLLTGCGESSQYSQSSYYEGGSSSSYATDSRQSYRSADSESYNTSARSSPPFGGYSVNPNAVCKTG